MKRNLQKFRWVLVVLTMFICLKSNAQQLNLSLTPSNYSGYNISCFGNSDGSINLTISGGIQPYQILWSTADTSEDLENLPAGYYNVRVTDSDSIPQMSQAEITLNEPRQVKIGDSIHQYPNGFHISVNGACNGMVSLTAEDGVAPYSWMWSDSSTSPSRTSLCAGWYSVVVFDANGCKAGKEGYLKEPPQNDWLLTGNAGINNVEHFIGTKDSIDLVFRTNDSSHARLKANGDFEIDRVITNRIVSPDTMVNIGDNTIHLWHVAQSIYGSPTNTQIPNNGTGIANKGTGIGYRTTPQGIFSLSLGHDVITRGENGFGFGYKLRTGDQVTNAMIIGTGYVVSPYNSDNFVNDIENSLMIGFNSCKPTLFVSPNTSTNKDQTGAVAINTTDIPAGYKLAVNGKIITEEVLIKNKASWPDFVFKPDYRLMTLGELKRFINRHQHLPGVPSAQNIETNGIETSEMIRILILKVEELTLHTIRQQEEIDRLNLILLNK